MMPRSLRPCLKLNGSGQASLPPTSPGPFPFASCSTVYSPRVHFPPSPSLTSTHLTHSSYQYDRAPIVVSPNVCALPERNERTYTPSSERRAPVKGSYFHPRAYEACEREPAAAPDVPPCPPLVPDLSSESDESDTPITTPPDPHQMQQPHLMPLTIHRPSTAHAPIPGFSTEKRAPMSFLPHPHGHPPSPGQERGREREGREKEKKKRSASRSRAQGHHRPRSSGFAAPELDGCLGGF